MDPRVKELIDSACGQVGLPRHIDVRPLETLGELLSRAAARHGDKPAFTSIGHTLSYADLDRLSARFAAWLQNHPELQQGDRVAVQIPNLIQYPVVALGVVRAGMVLVNINPLYSAREIDHQLSDAGAKVLVVLANVAKAAASILTQTPVRQVVITEVADLHPPIRRVLINMGARYIRRLVPDLDIPGAVTLRECLEAGAGRSLRPIQASAGNLALLQYTGGTTGLPKGAMLSHGNLVANVIQASALLETYDLGRRGEVMLQPLPLYHIYAFTIVMTELYHGGHIVLVPNPRDLASLVKAFRSSRPTVFCGLNTLFVSLCHNEGFRKVDFTDLKLTLSGGMALSHAAAEHWREVTGCEVSEGYGLTETSPVVSGNPAARRIIGTIGLPMPNTEIRVIDEQGEDVALGEAGELCVRGPQVMQGYWHNEEETAQVLDDKGWLKTGDMARIRDDGYLEIVDRKKDMIVVSGFNVYPNEVEDVLYEHDDILECAVVGVPDEKTAEAVKVFVVSGSGRLTEEDVRGLCREHLAAYKVPRYVEFRDELPKTPVGKILRRKLRE